MDTSNPGYDPTERPVPAFGAETQSRAAQDERMAGTPVTPGEAEPAGGYARMPVDAPGPAAGGTLPASSDTPMSTPSTARRFDPWNYRDEAGVGDGADVVGFAVQAIDGHIGKIDKSSTLVDDSYLVVDTGPWIFGKKVLLPAGTVNNVDSLEQNVYVDLTKAQIKESPEFDPEQFDTNYRDKLGGYYDSHYTGQPGTDDEIRDHSTYGDRRSMG